MYNGNMTIITAFELLYSYLYYYLLVIYTRLCSLSTQFTYSFSFLFLKANRQIPRLITFQSLDDPVDLLAYCK
jgi:hypothetical protein